MVQDSDQIAALFDYYVEEVTSGRRIVGKWERMAVERHLADLERSKQPDADIRFDLADGLRVCEYMVNFGWHTQGEHAIPATYVDSAGRTRLDWEPTRFRFTEISSWEVFITCCVFGWKKWDPDREDWFRRFRTVYISVARKNGKTYIIALWGQYLTAFDDEPSAEVYLAATKRDQAKRIWNQSKDSAMRHDKVREYENLPRELAATKPGTDCLFLITQSTSTMSVPEDGAIMVALGADADSHDGLNPSSALLDELHAHKNRKQYDVLRSGMGARRQPLLITITTAGEGQEGVCWDLDFDSQRVLEGVIEDDRLFAYMARAEDDLEITDPVGFAQANPNLHETVMPSFLRDEMNAAVNNPALVQENRRKYLNQWTETHSAWLGLKVWDENSLPPEPLDGRDCIAAIDIGKTRDLSALLWAARDGGMIDLYCKFYMPSESIEERVKRTPKVPIRRWIEQGLITVTAGRITNQNQIKEDIREIAYDGNLIEVAVDPREAWKLAHELEEEECLEVAEMNQGFWLSGEIRETERQLINAMVRHAGNPVLRWMFRNVQARTNEQERIKFDKKASYDSIDGIVAMVMAIGRLLHHVSGEGLLVGRAKA